MSQDIKIQYIAVGDLKSAEYNPRSWDEHAKEKLKASLREHGFVDPIIVNGSLERRNIIIGGHFRLKCARELGIKEVPAVYVHLNLEQEKALNLRLNRTGGDWDYELLKEFDVNLLLNVGFDDTDLSNIWDDILSIEDDSFDEQQAQEQQKDICVKTGDLFVLGRHRLLVADSTLPSSVQTLVGDERIDTILTDPPYNISLDYNNGLTTKGKYGGDVDDSLDDDGYRSFLCTTMRNALSVTKHNAHIFYFCDQSYIGMMQSLYSELGIANKRVCLWVKNNFNMTPHTAFNKGYEPCVYGTLGSPYLNPDVTNLHEIINKGVAPGNRCIDDIVDMFDIWLAKRDPANEYQHPTQKPLTLYEKPLRRCSKPGDNILDLFGGSGSCLLACEQMNRRAFVIEKDPVFAQVTLNRFEQMTGIKPKKIN